MVLPARIQKLNEINEISGECVVYIMSRDQRAFDNWALIYATERAKELELPLVVVFNLYPKVNGRIYQQYEFMLEGLKETQVALKDHGIDLIITLGQALENYKLIEDKLKPAEIYFDQSPLRGPRKVKDKFAKGSHTPIYIVDAHNIIPVWRVSQKEEFGAYTLRPKIYKQLGDYLDKFPRLRVNSAFKLSENIKAKELFINPDIEDWDKIYSHVKAEKITDYEVEFKPGYQAGMKALQRFIEERLHDYAEKRNDPAENFQSDLSPYLHFGQISAQRVALEILNFAEEKGIHIEFDPNRNKSGKPSIGLKNSIEAFLEELIVRRELAENFCYYNPDYDNFDGLRDWAKATLNKHTKDKRDQIYSLRELEEALTYDEAWNAAQRQLTTKGKIHGYMRMYWAKKILEWTEDPKQAIAYAVYLNDKYHIDGYDPNGYAGIMWSIGGIHDRVWFERPIFGQIRYMNYEGLKRKFDIKSYIDQWI